MLVLKNISATPGNDTYAEPGIHHHTVGFDLGGGAFRTLRLGPKGLVITDGKAQVALPAEELVKAVEPFLALERAAAAKTSHVRQ